MIKPDQKAGMGSKRNLTVRADYDWENGCPEGWPGLDEENGI